MHWAPAGLRTETLKRDGKAGKRNSLRRCRIAVGLPGGWEGGNSAFHVVGSAISKPGLGAGFHILFAGWWEVRSSCGGEVLCWRVERGWWGLSGFWAPEALCLYRAKWSGRLSSSPAGFHTCFHPSCAVCPWLSCKLCVPWLHLLIENHEFIYLTGLLLRNKRIVKQLAQCWVLGSAHYIIRCWARR